jgi:hypothetical protein
MDEQHDNYSFFGDLVRRYEIYLATIGSANVNVQPVRSSG